MGNFSWCYCDTGKIKRDPDGYAMPAHNQRLCICSMSHPASVLFPAEFGGKKAQINVPMYMNYGVFNGVDVYDLAADWNRRWASENPGFIMPSEKRFAERCRRRRDSEMSNYPGLTPEEVETEIAKGWSSFRCTPRRLSDFSWWPFYSDLSLSREELEIKCAGLGQQVQDLSGGNQQKVVMAKWLLSHCKILIFDEPTRGIDAGAKYEIYKLINTLAANGTAIIVISSDLPEVINLSTRVLVMRRGEVAGFINRDEATQEGIIKVATFGEKVQIGEENENKK